MLERRPVWGLILLLNVCVVIWRISVQEPAMLEAEFVGGYAATADLSNSNANANINAQIFGITGNHHHRSDQPERQSRQSRQKYFVARNLVEEKQLYAGKHLLAESADTNEIAAKVTRKAEENLRISGHTSSSISSSSSSSRVRDRKLNRQHQVLGLSTNSVVNSTPAPLVTAATLRSSADVHRTTTTAVTPLDLPPDDFHQLIDLHDFTYLIRQPGCSADIYAVILVHSAPGNQEKRQLIRDTWANVEALPRVQGSIPFRVIFLLGAVATDAQQLELERENFEYEDMVQGSFVDNYRNMTYKHVMALKWFLYNCEHAQILIKVDDDVFVNTPQLLIYLHRTLESKKTGSGNLSPSSSSSNKVKAAADVAAATATSTAMLMQTADNDSSAVDKSSALSNNVTDSHASHASQFNASVSLFRHPHDLLFCEFHVDAKVKRTFRSKWRVSAKEYPDRYYPPYCPGFAIVYSPDVVLKLYKAAQVSKYFWIDDVHITGILAQKVNITITSSRPYILYEKACDKLLEGRTLSSDVEFVYAWHLINPEQMQMLWTLYLKMVTQYLEPPTFLHFTENISPIKQTDTKSFYR